MAEIRGVHCLVSQGAGGIWQAIQASPMYQQQMLAGENAVAAQNAAQGKTGSGNEAMALDQWGQQFAGNTYNNLLQQMQPFLNYAATGAQGAGNVFTGLGSNLSSLFQNVGQQVNPALQNIGNLAWGTATSGAQAAANAALAPYQASANMLNLGSNLFGSAMKGLGGLATGGLSNLFGGSTSASPNPVSYGAAPVYAPYAPNAGTSYGAYGYGTGYDVKLKEDIEPIGTLADGLNVYSFRYKGDPVTRIGLMAQTCRGADMTLARSPKRSATSSRWRPVPDRSELISIRGAATSAKSTISPLSFSATSSDAWAWRIS